MKYYLSLSVLAVSIVAVSCSYSPELNKTVVKGTITITDSLDASDDYSGIGVTLINRDSAENEADTLLDLTSDRSGYFEGLVQFPQKKTYELGFSRDGAKLGTVGAILAENDTLNIAGELPDLENTLTLQSREHDALKTLNRVENSFQRVSSFIRGGAIPDSMLVLEFDKWSNLYWEVFEKNKNTLASYLAAEQSAWLLSGWDDERMLKRIDQALPAEPIISVAMKLGTPYIAKSKGFEAASNYLDSLSQITTNESLQEAILRDKIKMYFDSSRVKEAKSLLNNYENEYAEKANSQEWAKRIRYDLNYLAPGVSAPEFTFVTADGDSINKEMLNGQVYILEISPLANKEYQADLDRTVVIHEIYKNYGLKIFTIPLDQSEITVNAFFEERRKVWPIAKLGSFNVQEIIEKFNITQVPTRLLIDKDGALIRKYVRDEFQDVIHGLNKAFRTSNPS